MAAIAQKAEKPNVYLWTGSDKHGRKVKGESRAAGESMVRAELRRQGIIPATIKKKSNLFGTKKKKIAAGDIAVFSRQLATMMNAGVPLVQAFDIVGRGHENPSMQDLLLAIKSDVESGTALAEALSKHPLYFDDLFCNLRLYDSFGHDCRSARWATRTKGQEYIQLRRPARQPL